MEKYSENQSYVFLDFDGVMTNYTDEFGSFKNHDQTKYGVSNTCFNNLIMLLNKTGAKVILSTNWRRFEESGPLSYWKTSLFGDVQNPLPKFKKLLGQYCIGVLPKDRHITKSQALELWFKINNLDYTKCKYVIFDDDLREGYLTSKFKHNFIQTNAEFGLTSEDCQKAETLLMV